MKSSHIILSLVMLLSPYIYGMDMRPPLLPWYKQSMEFLENPQHAVKGSTLLELKQVMDVAPPFVKGTVKHLKDPKHYGYKGAPEYRTLILHGEPGTGKSTLAKAIAMYADWDVEFFTPADFQTGHRGEAAMKFRAAVDEILNRKTPTVMVVDEINQLCENSESKNHDNDQTAKEIWTTIDKTFGNDNFFLIGTTNRLYKIPPQIKSRIKARHCEIGMPRDVDGRYMIFENIMERQGVVTTAKGEMAVKEILKKEPKWTGRDFQEFIFSARQKLTDEEGARLDEKSCGIGEKVWEGVYNRMKSENKPLMLDYKELSDEDRQDLYQRQNMWTQVLMQRFQKHQMAGLRTPGITSEAGNYIMDNVGTENQKRLGKELLPEDKLKEPWNVL